MFSARHLSDRPCAADRVGREFSIGALLRDPGLTAYRNSEGALSSPCLFGAGPSAPSSATSTAQE